MTPVTSWSPRTSLSEIWEYHLFNGQALVPRHLLTSSPFLLKFCVPHYLACQRSLKNDSRVSFCPFILPFPLIANNDSRLYCTKLKSALSRLSKHPKTSCIPWLSPSRLYLQSRFPGWPLPERPHHNIAGFDCLGLLQDKSPLTSPISEHCPAMGHLMPRLHKVFPSTMRNKGWDLLLAFPNITLLLSVALKDWCLRVLTQAL